MLLTEKRKRLHRTNASRKVRIGLGSWGMPGVHDLPIARMYFLMAVAKVAPEVLVDLAKSVLPRWIELTQLKEINQTENIDVIHALTPHSAVKLRWEKLASASEEFRPWLKPLKEALVGWATVWNLRAPDGHAEWAIMAALDTVTAWSERPTLSREQWRYMPAAAWWGNSTPPPPPGIPAPTSDLMSKNHYEEQVRGYLQHTLAEQHLPKEAAEGLLRLTHDQRTTYWRQVEEHRKRQGYVQASVWQADHFEWAVLRQVKQLRYSEIEEFAANQRWLERGADQNNIQKAVRKIILLLPLKPAPPHSPGRRPQPSK